jgi:hypothetical protein
MNRNNPNLMLLVISAFNLLLEIFIWSLTKSDQSASLGYMFILFIGWIVLLIATGIITYKNKIKLKYWNLLLFIFSTPIPFILFILITSEEPIIGTQEYNKNNHRIKEITYKNRKEYSTSIDSTSEEYPVPLNENYHLDSIIYYSESGNIIKTTHLK